MCNRYRMSARQYDLAVRHGLDPANGPEPPTLPPPELFPKRLAWTVRNAGAGGRELAAMTWGWPVEIKGRTSPVTNVRNLTSPMWRNALARAEQRCLVPFTDFCEWEGEKGSKIARWFAVPSRPIAHFAGIWRPSPTGDIMAFLTCEPNSLVAPIHPKAMPVILDDEGEAAWLAGAPAAELAQPFPAQLMTVTAPD